MQIKTTTAALLCISLSLFTFSATAGIEKNDKTVSVFGAYTSDDYSDTLIVQLAGGFFLTDTLELQGIVLQVSSEDDFGNTTSVGGYGANANLYLPGKNPDIVPYVGAGAQLVLTDFNGNTDSALGLNGQVGIKQFLNEDIAINYQAQYLTSSDYDAFILSVGISIFLQ